MKTILAIPFLALMISPAFAQIKMPPEAKRLFEASMRNTLRDPESARYRDVKYVKQHDGSYFYCGYVNAKNAFGGYTGERRFIAAAGKGYAAASISNGDPIVDRYSIKVCAQKGLFP